MKITLEYGDEDREEAQRALVDLLADDDSGVGFQPA